ncbi:MAG: hypothetical protein AB8B83_02145 [Bdellovibrionales bacterium]
MLLEPSTFFAIIGFTMASYAVMGNDAVQTLGTFMASNLRLFKWYWLWLAASLVLCATLLYGWAVHGDISFGRLDKIPYQEVQWYHAAAPLVLVILTRFGIPVSTTFLVLSVFASTFVMEKMLIKSAMGYAVAAVTAYALWMIIARVINERYDKVKREKRAFWRTFQWVSTGFLWFTWLSHDVANIAVFLPRELSFIEVIAVMTVMVGSLGLIFRQHGGKINNIVLEKSGARFMRSATFIDLTFALLLIIFKEINNIPMSTTWVFVGLLAGRELAIATTYGRECCKEDFTVMLSRDFIKMMTGLMISVGVVIAIHYFFKGA